LIRLRKSCRGVTRREIEPRDPGTPARAVAGDIHHAPFDKEVSAKRGGIYHRRPCLRILWGLISSEVNSACTGTVCPQIGSTDLDALICKAINRPPASANHLARLEEQGWGNGKAEDLGSLQIDDQIEGGGLLPGRSPGLAPFRILST
jgi:hypothetical protein